MFNYDKYLRTDKVPTQWCYGCGDGNILKSILRSLESLGIDNDDLAMVSGIGCSGRMSSYMDFNTMHTTHGRALAYATGIKLANMSKHVIVSGGDGDGLAIGGNHFIHACRRNIDITYIMINNFIYGLTNSQVSPTTPEDSWTSTTEYGNIDPNFDACKLAEAAGATYIARGTVTDVKKLDKYIKEGIKHKGFSFIEVISNCHVNYGRKNSMPNANDTLAWIENKVIDMDKYDALSKEEQKGRIKTGILFQDKEKREYTEAYKEVQNRAKGKK